MRETVWFCCVELYVGLRTITTF